MLLLVYMSFERELKQEAIPNHSLLKNIVTIIANTFKNKLPSKKLEKRELTSEEKITEAFTNLKEPLGHVAEQVRGLLRMGNLLYLKENPDLYRRNVYMPSIDSKTGPKIDELFTFGCYNDYVEYCLLYLNDQLNWLMSLNNHEKTKAELFTNAEVIKSFDEFIAVLQEQAQQFKLWQNYDYQLLNDIDKFLKVYGITTKDLAQLEITERNSILEALKPIFIRIVTTLKELAGTNPREVLVMDYGLLLQMFNEFEFGNKPDSLKLLDLYLESKKIPPISSPFVMTNLGWWKKKLKEVAIDLDPQIKNLNF